MLTKDQRDVLHQLVSNELRVQEYMLEEDVLTPQEFEEVVNYKTELMEIQAVLEEDE